MVDRFKFTNKFYSYAFQYSCKNNKLEIAKWLVYLGMQKNFTPINIHVDNDDVFRWARKHEQLEIIELYPSDYSVIT